MKNISNWVYYLAGIGTIAAIVVIALAYGATIGSEFPGADGEGGEAVGELNPDYVVWWEGVWGDYELPSETESMLFALQAAIGAIIIGYVVGYLHASDKARKGKL